MKVVLLITTLFAVCIFNAYAAPAEEVTTPAEVVPLGEEVTPALPTEEQPIIEIVSESEETEEELSTEGEHDVSTEGELEEHTGQESIPEEADHVEVEPPEDIDMMLKQIFKSMDSDNDDIVTAQEMINFLKRKFEFVLENIDEMVGFAFKHADLNGDKKLTYDEFELTYKMTQRFI